MHESRPDPAVNPVVLLQRAYMRTRRALDGSPRQRSIALQEAVDETIDDVSGLIRDGSPELLGQLLDGMDVEKVHPELLDTVLALTEDMSVPSLDGFRDRVGGRMARVDELLKPVVLRRSHGQDSRGGAQGGEVVSTDVRKDAREIYRKKAKEFGDALRKDGNLDGFYKTERMKARAQGEDPDAVTPERRPPADPPDRTDDVDDLVMEKVGGKFVVRKRDGR